MSLTAYTGKCDLRTDGQIIDSKIVNCDGMLNYAKNVLIKNSVINSAIMNNVDTASLTVQDSNVNGGRTSWGALDGANLTVLRSEITGGQHNVHCSENCVVKDSYLHGQYNDPNAAYHNNGFISNGGSNILLRHNTIWCSAVDNGKGGGCTADVSLFGDFEAISKVTIDGNYFHTTQGGYCGTFGYNPSSPNAVVVSNNLFQKGTNNKCGTYGPTTSYRGRDAASS